MAGPYRCINMIIEVNGAAIGVANGLDIMISKEGGNVEYVYGTSTGFIVFGGKKGTFTLQRLYMVSTEDTDLLYDLFDSGAAFTISGYISGLEASTKITLTGCKASSWKPTTADANSLVGEEIRGEATGWTTTIS